MLEHPPLDQPQARGVLFGAAPTITAPPERHWFVPDAPDGYYCAACGLPEYNRARHVPRERSA